MRTKITIFKIRIKNKKQKPLTKKNWFRFGDLIFVLFKYSNILSAVGKILYFHEHPDYSVLENSFILKLFFWLFLISERGRRAKYMAWVPPVYLLCTTFTTGNRVSVLRSNNIFRRTKLTVEPKINILLWKYSLRSESQV